MSRFKSVIDIGSGVSKLLIARCDVNRVSSAVENITVVHEQGVELLLAKELHRNGGKRLSMETREKCEHVIQSFVDVVKATHGADDGDLYGIGTQVFRAAENGPEILQYLSDRFDIPLRLISQTEEAELGYATGLAGLKMNGMVKDESKVVVWDSGGASFQFSQASGTDALQAPLGSIVVTEMLYDIAKVVFTRPGETIEQARERSPNPVNEETASKLETRIRKTLESSLAPLSDSWRKRFADRDTAIVGIGGEHCAFFVTRTVLDHMRGETWSHPRIMTLDDVHAAVQYSLHRKDEEAREMFKFSQPDMIVPEIVLVHTVMKFLGIGEFMFVKTMGGCLGLVMLGKEFVAGR